MIPSVVIIIVLVVCPVGGWYWMKAKYDEMMFVPKPHDQQRVLKLLKPHMGDNMRSLRVVRVDRDVSAWYFVMVYDGDPKSASWHAPGSSDGEKGAYVSSQSTEQSPGDAVWHKFEVTSGSYNIVVWLESLGNDQYYGGVATYPSPTFEKRFEQNRKYATDDRDRAERP